MRPHGRRHNLVLGHYEAFHGLVALAYSAVEAVLLADVAELYYSAEVHHFADVADLRLIRLCEKDSHLRHRKLRAEGDLILVQHTARYPTFQIFRAGS